MLIYVDGSHINYLIWKSEIDALSDTTYPKLHPSESAATVENATVTPSGGTLSSHTLRDWDVLSPEFVNYLLALIVFSVRYPSVFWYSHHMYSFMFSFLLFISNLYFVFAYCGLQIVYKLSVNKDTGYDLNLLLPSTVIVILYIISNTIVFFSSILVFNFGYYHYDSARRKFLKSRLELTGALRPSTPPPSGCQGYVPHTLASLSLLVFVSCRSPIIYDSIAIYRKTGNSVTLNTVVWDVIYMFVWISLWFIFTIKQKWRFRVMLVKSTIPRRKSEIYLIRDQELNRGYVNGLDQPPRNRNLEMVRRDHGSYQAINTNSRHSNQNAAGQRSLKAQSNQRMPDMEDHRGSRSSVSSKSRSVKKNNSGRVTFSSTTKDNLSKQHMPKKDNRARNNEDSLDEYDRAARNRYLFGMSETPENTLTRNYRFSIRDKCGQYYRHAEDVEPDETESSPILPPRKPRGRPRSEIETDIELHQQFSSSRIHQSPTRSNPTLPSAANRSPERYVNKPSKHYDDQNVNKKQYYKDNVDFLIKNVDHRGRSHSRSPERSKPHTSTTENNTLEGNVPTSTSEYTPSLQHSTPKIHNNQKANSLNREIYMASKSKEAFKKRPYSLEHRTKRPFRAEDAGRSSARELRTSSKPEIGRRDSALPSSNETSSNDSAENGLCSQV